MNDLEQDNTKQAYGMTTAPLGMSEKLPNLCYYNNDEYPFKQDSIVSAMEKWLTTRWKMVNEQYDESQTNFIWI